MRRPEAQWEWELVATVAAVVAAEDTAYAATFGMPADDERAAQAAYRCVYFQRETGYFLGQYPSLDFLRGWRGAG